MFNRGQFARFGIFLQERYPPMAAAAMSVLVATGLFLLSARVHHSTGANWGGSYCLAIVTYFLFLLFVRICDELKDVKVDSELFPERCLPSGRVLYRDLHVLLAIVLALLITPNLISGANLGLFVILMFYGYLIFKWFFFPRQISQNLPLALLTHNPVLFLLSLYLLSLSGHANGTAIFDKANVMIAVAFWMPGLAWEISRKIKPPDGENAYTTYSKVFGYKVAALLPACALLIQCGLLIFLGFEMRAHLGFVAAIVACWLTYFFFLLRFIYFPSVRTAQLRPITETFIVLICVVALAMALVSK